MKRTSPDILLINPRSRTQVYQGLGTELAAIENPVWAGLMATFLRGQGLAAEILDAEADELPPAEVARQVRDAEPALCVVVVYGHQPSASTQIMPAAGAVCRAVKELSPGQRVLMVGGHVAALPARTLEEEACDYVGAGEGLWTMVDLAQAIRANGRAPELPKVRGLWYRDGARLCCTANPPLLKDLDGQMPGVAWDLLPMRKYRAHNWHCFGHLQRQPYAAIYTTLGCPYHCSFCCIQAPFKSGERELGLKETANSYRYWNPRVVGDELERLANLGVRNLKIADEMFVLNKRHVLAICDEIINRGLDFNIWAYARIDTVKEGMLPRMKQAGFNWLAFGIEAANSRVQADVDKRFNEDDVFDTVARVKEAGINIIGNFIFGLPEDDRASMQQTLDLALALNCEFANLYSAMAYPGSPLYAMALAQGWELPGAWSGYSQHSVDCKPLRTKYLSGEEVLRFRDEAFQAYFNAPRYLNLVREKFGPATVEHLRQMTAHKLIRQYSSARAA